MILDNDSNDLTMLSKLRWACRRGMLELDVLLGNFVNEAYEKLNVDEKALFAELLTCTDPELFAWLLGSETAPHPHLVQAVNMVRAHAYSRFHS